MTKPLDSGYGERIVGIETSTNHLRSIVGRIIFLLNLLTVLTIINTALLVWIEVSSWLVWYGA